MLALGARIVVGEAMPNAVVDAAVVAQFEMQAVPVATRAPIASVEGVGIPESEGGADQRLVDQAAKAAPAAA